MALEGGDAAGVDLLAVPVIDGAAGLDAAALDPGQHDLVAGLHLGDGAAGLQHGAGALMAEAMRHPFVLALVAAPFHHLRAAGAGIGDLDQHLAGLQRGISISASTRGCAGLDEKGGFGFHSVRSQLQRVDDLVGDLVAGQAQHLAGIFLLAGFLEEGVGRAEAQELLGLRLGVDQPFGDRRAEAADQRMLLDRRDQLEAREGVASGRPRRAA